MSRLRPYLELLRVYRVLGQEPVEVSPGDTGLLSGNRDVPAGLGQEAGDGLLLKHRDHALLGLDEPLLGGDLDRARVPKIEREVGHLHLLIRGQHHGPLDDFLELAEVAGPAVAPQEVQGILRAPVPLFVPPPPTLPPAMTRPPPALPPPPPH